MTKDILEETRWNEQKKTEFKYYFCTGNDFSDSKAPEYIIKYNEKIYEISIFTLFNEPQVSEMGPSFPQQLKISYNDKQDIGELLDFCNKTHCENYLDDDLEDYNTLTMYICEENYWDNNGKKKKRDMDSIYIPEKLKTDLITVLINLTIVEKKEEEIKPIETSQKNINKKIGRNEPCFCGSGKKYKHCCGAL